MLPPPPLRLLPAGATVAGWELHPLKIDAFARRTMSPFFHPLAIGVNRNIGPAWLAGSDPAVQTKVETLEGALVTAQAIAGGEGTGVVLFQKIRAGPFPHPLSSM